MKTISYTTVDKSEWGAGPWQGEPDKKQWLDDATGYPCLIVRSSHVTGSLCGYVGVPKTHAVYGKDYNDIDAEVHGGLTFAGACHKHGSEESSICHIVEEGESDDVWWLGFDCAHCSDLSPAMRRTMRGIIKENYEEHEWEIYRDMKYVTDQVEFLAKQLKELEMEAA